VADPRRHKPDGDTVAIVAVDREGGAVCLIQSLFHAFGAGILEPETGIVCHNRGATFSLDPAAPSAFAPGRRPPHTLTPVMVRRGGKLEVVLGTMGGWAQPQILTQILLHLAQGAAPREAIDAPRWTIDRAGDGSGAEILAAEAGVPEATRRAIASGEPDATVVDADRLGHAHVIVLAGEAAPIPAADPRSDGAAEAGPAG
jgi:gamma-glutamyltranspeptidase/glutathione hydrolase